MTPLIFRPRQRPSRPPEVVPGRRLRRVGWLVLLAGLGTAGLFYGLQTWRSEPAIEDLMPGSAAANSRQMGLLYGGTGEMAWELREQVQRPIVQAAAIAATAALVAIVCFRMAWLEVHDEGGQTEGGNDR